MQIPHDNTVVTLKGVSASPKMGPPISYSQLQALYKTDSVLYMVQVQTPQSPQESSNTIAALPDELQSILKQYESAFSPPSQLPPARSGDHQIPLMEGAQPFSLRPYRYNPTQKSKIETQISEMLAKGWIQESTSPFSSPALLVRKKTGDWRLCVDYRRLNTLTTKNKYPLSLIEDLLDELYGAQWFTSLDLCSGFHQIRLAEDEEYKTTF